MKIRRLMKKDAEYMLEWMKDFNVINNLANDFMSKSLIDCYDFIEHSYIETEKNIHLAICNNDDEYQGTVSLKKINREDKNAEYAIAMRTCAMGKGFSTFATDAILHIAFERLQLEKVYLYVYEKNIRAIKFYRKYGFIEEGNFRKHRYIQDEYQNVIWFSLLREEFAARK